MNRIVSISEANDLISVVYKFIQDNKISCPEATANDSVYENAPDLVYNLAQIIGYYEYPEDDE